MRIKKKESMQTSKPSPSRRTPQQQRTRKDSPLAPDTLRLLIVAVETAGEETSPEAIATGSPAFGARGSPLRKAVYNRISFLRNLKKSDNKEYW